MKSSKGTIGIVVRVSDVKGRDKRGDRFISPAEQIGTASAYCRADGYDVLVIEPQDLNVSHTTPLDERDGMSKGLRLIATGEIQRLAFSSQDRIGTLAITRELRKRLLDAGLERLLSSQRQDARLKNFLAECRIRRSCSSNKVKRRLEEGAGRQGRHG
jgi:hypothetical protein